jgi:protein ImuA
MTDLALSAPLERLRHDLARLAATARPAHPRLTFGVARLDEALGGGLEAGAIHEILLENHGDGGAATLLPLTLWARAPAPRRLVWIIDCAANAEIGEPYGPGLAELGLDPSLITLVRTRHARDALAAAEAALGTRGIAAVIVETIGKTSVFDHVAGRRLALAAGQTGATGFILRVNAPDQLMAATRWRVAAWPSLPDVGGVPGLPALTATLLRNRLGPTGPWRLGLTLSPLRFEELGHDIGHLAQPIDGTSFSRDRFAVSQLRPASPAEAPSAFPDRRRA